MKLKDRALLSAALACAALAGRAAAQDPQAPPKDPAAAAALDAREIVATWPADTRDAALALIDKYGQPAGASDRMLVWDDEEPWTRVTLYRDSVELRLPSPRDSFLEDTIDYSVPAGKVADLLRFDPGLVVDEARGTLSSQSDSEKANILALNLADEIVAGKRGVASARDFMNQTLQKLLAGKSSPYAERLLFAPEARAPARAKPKPEPPPATGY